MRIACFAVVLALGMTGCLDEQRYITPEVGGPWAYAIDMSTPPFFASEDGDVYLVEQIITIPFREPTDDELAALGDIGDQQIPYPQLPWLERGDVSLATQLMRHSSVATTDAYLHPAKSELREAMDAMERAWEEASV